MTNGNPKLFISYSWSNQDHEKWVINLANELVENGVDIILDKWHLKEGQDANAFMEKMVTDPDIKKVAIICDQVYAQKAGIRFPFKNWLDVVKGERNIVGRGGQL